MKVINDLFDYEDLKIIQNEDYFKFSLDSIILAEYVKVKNDDINIIDLCSGNLPVPMILSTKFDRAFNAIEIQKDVYEYGLESLKLNKLTDKVNYINDDLKNIFNYTKKGIYDIVTCNPPYFKSSIKNTNDIKAIARHEICIDLENIIKISSELLKNNKTLYMVHRAERLDEIIILCNKYKINVKEVIFLNNSKQELIGILVKAVKNSKYGIKIKYVNNVDKLTTYKNMFEVI